MRGVNVSDRFRLAQMVLEEVQQFPGGAPGHWTATATNGTVAALDERGGGLSLTTAATDNDLGTLTLDAKPLNVAANKPISFAGRLQYAEAATNVANIFIGMISGTASAAMGDNGAGPPASYTGFGFHKKDGDTVWSVESSVGGTQVTTQLVAGASNGINTVDRTAGGSNYVLFEIDIIPKDSTKCDVIYKIDGVHVATHTDFVYTSAAAMAPVALVKAGSAVAQALKVNLMAHSQVI